MTTNDTRALKNRATKHSGTADRASGRDSTDSASSSTSKDQTALEGASRIEDGHDQSTSRELVTDGGAKTANTDTWDDLGYIAASSYRVDVALLLLDRQATPSMIADETDSGIAHVSRALADLRERDVVELLVPEETQKGRIYGLTDYGQELVDNNTSFLTSSQDSHEVMTDGGRPREEMLDVELVLGAGSPHDDQVRLDVTSATVVDRGDGRLEITLADGEIEEYFAELGLKNRRNEFATDGGVEQKATIQRPHPTDLSLFQQEILYYLAEDGPEYGLGIKRALEERYGEEINHGRLYPNLDDLVEMNLIEKSELDKRTNQYALTDDAKELLRRDAQRRFNAVDTSADRHQLADAKPRQQPSTGGDD